MRGCLCKGWIWLRSVVEVGKVKRGTCKIDTSLCVERRSEYERLKLFPISRTAQQLPPTSQANPEQARALDRSEQSGVRSLEQSVDFSTIGGLDIQTFNQDQSFGFISQCNIHILSASREDSESFRAFRTSSPVLKKTKPPEAAVTPVT